MITRINRFLAAVLVPLLIGTQSSPLFWIKQQQYKPKELISLSQSEKITEDVHITAHRGVNAEARHYEPFGYHLIYRREIPRSRKVSALDHFEHIASQEIKS